MTVYHQLKAADIPTSNHCSDLYCKVTSESRSIIDQYEYKSNVTTFKSNIDGTLWYDIPFAFDPYWEEAGVKGV
jgi:hypothetical protein